ncbi:flavin reductase [Brevibacterium luteolum]|nr:flavin reductase [Brevibacterium luteolum]
MSADPEDFKHAFRHHPAGVAVITAQSPDGPIGLTVSSLASVTLQPPMLHFSVSTARYSASRLLGAETFVVNTLGAEHAEIARAFARPEGPRFTPEQGFATLPDGDPYLPGAHGVLHCRFASQTPAGDSTVCVGEIIDIITEEPGRALVYVDREFYALDAADRI